MTSELIQAALASVAKLPATEAARALLFDFLDGKRLTRPHRDALAAIAERATSVDRVSVSTPGEPATALGDNYFQCPHCAEVFEGEQVPACAACTKPLASNRVAIAIALGAARVWLCPCEPQVIDPRAPRVLRLAWMRVESGPRWFELLDDRGRDQAERQLSAAGAMPPNVAPVGRRDGDRTLLIHGTKDQIHVVEGEQRRDDGTGSVTELAVRELTSVLYPDAPPEAPSSRAIAQRGHARNELIEAAIASDVDHADAYSVYADWLQGQGDPRGELIALQLAGDDVAASELLDAHEHHFFGRVASSRHLLVVSPTPKLGLSTRWRWGYLERLWISNKGQDDVVEALANLLDHPSCRFLRELTVGLVTYDDNSYEQIAAVIGERSLPHLHTLVLGDFCSEETELNWSSLGDVSPMYRAVPNLRRLALRSGSMTVGAIELPTLEELTIVSGGFDSVSLSRICGALWPVLTTLSIQLGNEETFTLPQLQPIFDGTRFPRVTRLGLGNSTITDEICRGLASSAIASRLVSLDLSKGTLGDEGIRALAAGRFPNLAHLDVSSSWLTDEGVAIARGLAKEVDVTDQSDDDGNPDERYIGAYE